MEIRALGRLVAQELTREEIELVTGGIFNSRGAGTCTADTICGSPAQADDCEVDD